MTLAERIAETVIRHKTMVVCTNIDGSRYWLAECVHGCDWSRRFKYYRDDRQGFEAALRAERQHITSLVATLLSGEAAPPEPLGRCAGCGEYIPESEVDGVGGHVRPEANKHGDAVPVHCGPVESVAPPGAREALEKTLRAAAWDLRVWLWNEGTVRITVDGFDRWVQERLPALSRSLAGGER